MKPFKPYTFGLAARNPAALQKGTGKPTRPPNSMETLLPGASDFLIDMSSLS